MAAITQSDINNLAAGNTAPYAPARLNDIKNVAAGNTAPYSNAAINNLVPGYRTAAGYSSGGGGGGYSTGGGSYSAPDPYAKWGGKTQYDALKAGYGSQKQGIINSAYAAAGQGGREYHQGVLGLVDQIRSGQRNIDTKSVNNELAKKQGVAGVQGMVGRGIRSGGIQLANRNAADSSAAGALAGAYGDIGKRQMSQIGNQYELGNRDIQNEQMALDEQEAIGVRNLGFSKEKVLSSIVNEAQSALQSLDAQIAGASLPDRIAIEQEKEAIRNHVMSTLSQFDAILQQNRDSINPLSDAQRREKAAELYTAGTDLGEGAFDYQTEAPAQFSGTGPFASELPLFTFNKKRMA